MHVPVLIPVRLSGLDTSTAWASWGENDPTRHILAGEAAEDTVLCEAEPCSTAMIGALQQVCTVGYEGLIHSNRKSCFIYLLHSAAQAAWVPEATDTLFSPGILQT